MGMGSDYRAGGIAGGGAGKMQGGGDDNGGAILKDKDQTTMISALRHHFNCISLWKKVLHAIHVAYLICGDLF